MEIADNQHPIDLSRKCNYYKQPYKSITPKPLPDLIPISMLARTTQLGDKRDDFYFNKFAVASNDQYQFKDQLKIRTDLPKFRSVPHLPKSMKISRLKSKSDSKIFSAADSRRNKVPILENAQFNGEYYSSFSNTSPFERYSWKPHNDDESLSMSRKYMKPGPGVSTTTIQSLRKLLDKRKSRQQE